MNKTCPGCGSILQIDEKKYNPGEKVTVECQLCGKEIVFEIPSKTNDTSENKKNDKEEKKTNQLRREGRKTPPPLPNETGKVEEKNISSNSANIKSKHNDTKDKSNPIKTWSILLILVLIGGAVGGYFYYNNVYLPEKIDREAPRMYSFVTNLALRSSTTTGVDYNKIKMIPYGTELITYENGIDWSKVKVDHKDKNEPVGYVSSPYILNAYDFMLLNSIFGDADSRNVIETAKCRRAILNYFKNNHFIGKLSEEERTRGNINIMPTSENQWQIFSRPSGVKPNTTIFKRVVNPKSKFTDFGVIIQNIQTGDRRFLYFTFDDDETPHLVFEQSAPAQGDVVDVKTITSSMTGQPIYNVIYD